MMEIYNEKIRDLFEPKKTNLKVRDHPKTGSYVQDLTMVRAAHSPLSLSLSPSLSISLPLSISLSARLSRTP